MIKSHLLIKSKEAPKYPNMVFATIYGVIAMIETLNSALNDSDIFKIEEKIRLIRQKNRI